MFVPKFMKIDQLVQKLKTHRYGDLISLLLLLKEGTLAKILYTEQKIESHIYTYTDIQFSYQY
jgi:hypothetical protein